MQIAGHQSATSYQTTYYPGTPDRSQAAPVQFMRATIFPSIFR